MSSADNKDIENTNEELDALISNVSSPSDLEVDFKALGENKVVNSEEYISMFDIIRAKNAAAAKKDLPSQPSQITLSASNKKTYTILKNSIVLAFVITLFAITQLPPTNIIDSPNIKNEANTQNETNTQKEVATQTLDTTFETEINYQDDKQLNENSYQEAIAFTEEINAVAAFTAANDAKEQAIEVAQDLYTGSYSSGIFTSSVGISYQINFDGDTATLGDIFEGEIPVVNNQLTTPESNIYIDNKQLPYNVSLQSYQEATAFIKTVNALAAFTVELDAIEQAVQAIEDFSLASYSSGIFTSSDGTSYQIDFVGDTASLGKSYPKSN